VNLEICGMASPATDRSGLAAVGISMCADERERRMQMDDQQVKTAALELTKESPVCVMGTVDDEGYPCLRPMYTMEIADDFTVYFATARDTMKSKQIQANSRVSLSWSAYSPDMANWRHAEIRGKAVITDDKELRHRLWMDELSRYFESADNPNFVIVVVKPTELLFTDDHSYPPYSVKF
jgi:general stress protein 26